DTLSVNKKNKIKRVGDVTRWLSTLGFNHMYQKKVPLGSILTSAKTNKQQQQQQNIIKTKQNLLPLY
ncbi:hypothetical protein V4Y02_23420, partial [Escherichia coli]